MSLSRVNFARVSVQYVLSLFLFLVRWTHAVHPAIAVYYYPCPLYRVQTGMTMPVYNLSAQFIMLLLHIQRGRIPWVIITKDSTNPLSLQSASRIASGEPVILDSSPRVNQSATMNGVLRALNISTVCTPVYLRMSSSDT